MATTRTDLATRAWYHLYPLGFLEAEPRNPAPGQPDGPVAHRLRALDPWVDHVVELGAGGILLGPVFESETHGYDTVDACRVDRRLGDEADLVRFVERCHDRDLAVLLDGVFNHVGRGHPAFAEVLRHGRDAATRAWFHLDFDRSGPDGFRYRTFEGHDRLVALDHEHPAVLDWAVDVATYWLDRGIDGWRLDAAYQVPLPFWAAFGDRVRQRHPEAYLVGEVIRGDFARVVREGGLDAVTQYELWKAIWSSLNDRNLFELAHALDRHAEFAAEFPPWTFLGNHDTTHIASQLDDERHLGHAVALLALLPGTPAVYAGDEQGASGVKRHEEGGDDDVRRPPPAAAGAPLDSRQLEVWELHRHLLGLRAARPWVTRARLDVVDLSNEVMAVEVRGDHHHRLRLVLNLSDTAGSGLPDGWRVLAGRADPAVPGHGWAVGEPTG